MFFCTSQWLKWLKMAELLRCFYIRRLLIVILKDKELKWGKHIYLSRQLNNIWAINQILFFRLSHIMFPVQYSCLENPMDRGTWKAAVHGVEKNRTRLSDFTFTFHFHALEKEMATHSSVLAWRIPGTGEPGGLPSMGSHRVRHYWSDLAAAAACHVTSSPEWGDHGNRINVSKNQVSPRCITAHNLPR